MGRALALRIRGTRGVAHDENGDSRGIRVMTVMTGYLHNEREIASLGVARGVTGS